MNQQKIGHFIKELRTENGLTQEQLAEALGVTNRSVSRWENGNNMPDLDLLIELAKVFDVGVGELLDGERKENDKNIDKKDNDTLEKVADYASANKDSFAKSIRFVLWVGLAASVVAFAIDFFEFENTPLFSFVKGFANGLMAGAIIVALIMTSRCGAKFRAAKLKLINKTKKKLNKIN